MPFAPRDEAPRPHSPAPATTRSAGAARPHRSALVLFTVAALLGLLHAAPSVYWAAGGRALLETVGTFAVELADSGRPEVPWMLLGIGLAKAAGALVPLLDHLRPPPHTWARVVSWIGAATLLAWGGAGTIGAWIGVVTDATTWARPAVVGHALLWDPLFVLWGVALALALWTSRRQTA